MTSLRGEQGGKNQGKEKVNIYVSWYGFGGTISVSSVIISSVKNDR